MGSFDDLIKDYLADLSPDEVVAWYLRLAKFIEQKNTKVKNPLAPQLLRYWVQGQGKKLTFPAPDHLQNSEYVVDILKDHRKWYLSDEKFKGKWVGVVPRLQGKPGFTKWEPWEPKYLDVAQNYGQLIMDLNSLVEIPVKVFGSLSDGDFDLLTALHGFQLESSVSVHGYGYGGKVMIFFDQFMARAFDRYDWDPDKHFTVPNPDHNNPFNVANPVAPRMDKIIVYHKNAIRAQNAGKAFAYDLESTWWTIKDLAIRGEATVDI